MIFDGDDTLWITEPLYDGARCVAGSVVADASFDVVEWDRLQREIDVRNVALLGLSPTRFPTSCVQALEVLAESSGRLLDETLRRSVYLAAAQVFERTAPLALGAQSIVEQLHSCCYLALLTKGDRTVQAGRVRDSGLTDLFDSVDVVDRKDPSTFAAVLERFGVGPERAWSVGNSLRSDILPAVQAGLNGIVVDAHVWEFERFERHEVPQSIPIIPNLLELPVVLRQSGFDFYQTVRRIPVSG